jgi:catechol 2,3-dioxygenase-like lactoylglutathione lyase family enzyme
MSTLARGVSTITLFVGDLGACRDFYRDRLELPLVFEDPESAVFKVGALLVNLLDVSASQELIEPARTAEASSGNSFVLTVPVADVDGACRDLRARGVDLLNGPMDRPWGVRTASFTDPAGHIWELAQQLAGA